jgi:hypothetical protein
MNPTIRSQFANRFKIIPQMSDLSKENHAHEFAQHVVSSRVDLVNRTVTVILRENIKSTTIKAIERVVASSYALCVACLDNLDESTFTLNFSDARVIKHEMLLNYANINELRHEVVWKFRTMRTIIGTGQLVKVDEDDSLPDLEDFPSLDKIAETLRSNTAHKPPSSVPISDIAVGEDKG